LRPFDFIPGLLDLDPEHPKLGFEGCNAAAEQGHHFAYVEDLGACLPGCYVLDLDIGVE